MFYFYQLLFHIIWSSLYLPVKLIHVAVSCMHLQFLATLCIILKSGCPPCERWKKSDGFQKDIYKIWASVL